MKILLWQCLFNFDCDSLEWILFLSPPVSSDLSISGMCCLLTVATGMLTYTNAHTITYGGYVNLLKRQLALSLKFLMAHVSSGPLSVVTAILAVLTIVFAILGAISPEFATFDDDDK